MLCKSFNASVTWPFLIQFGQSSRLIFTTNAPRLLVNLWKYKEKIEEWRRQRKKPQRERRRQQENLDNNLSNPNYWKRDFWGIYDQKKWTKWPIINQPVKWSVQLQWIIEQNQNWIISSNNALLTKNIPNITCRLMIRQKWIINHQTVKLRMIDDWNLQGGEVESADSRGRTSRKQREQKNVRLMDYSS